MESKSIKLRLSRYYELLDDHVPDITEKLSFWLAILLYSNNFFSQFRGRDSSNAIVEFVIKKGQC